MVEVWASGYVGIPFLQWGRDPAGWDCWGLVYWCFKHHFNVRLPSYSERYQDTKDAEHLAGVIAGELDPWRQLTKRERRQLGDVVLMRCGPHETHVGLVMDQRRMLHVRRSIGTQFEDYDGIAWARRVVGIYRHEALDHAA